MRRGEASSTKGNAEGIGLRSLGTHLPTGDQLQVVRDNDPGNVLIRGAAGSGKTTTSLMRLELVTRYWLDMRDRSGSAEPVRVLALAFNRTLAGYVSELARQQMPNDPRIVLDVDTIAGANVSITGFRGDIWEGRLREDLIWSLGKSLGFSREFLLDEVEYILGRFPPGNLTEYLTSPTGRRGRGRTPLVTPEDRVRIFEAVITAYEAHKRKHGLVDWNDIAVLAAATRPTDRTLRHVVVVDEAQDFSVNQMRSVVTHLAPEHSLTVVTDTAQRIYPRYLYFPEAGLPPFDRIYSLTRNFRNTLVIAGVAAGMLSGLTLDDDAAVPVPASAADDTGHARPVLIAGKFSQQMSWVLDALSKVDLGKETAAILTLRGKGALQYTRAELTRVGLDFVELQQAKTWPDEDANLAISTLHSAKGLEFDHVYILGLNGEFTAHDEGEDDATLDRWRRLLGMAVGRARKTVALGYKPQDPSRLIDFVDRELVDEINLQEQGW
jgi:superfamily I DNA/RNA helicase